MKRVELREGLFGLTRIFSSICLLIVLVPMSTLAQSGGWVDSTLASMTIEEKVGQVFIADLVAVYSHRESPNFRLAENFVRKYHVGGFVLAGGSMTDIAVMTNALQRESKVPLIINADLEAGLWFNHPYHWQRGRAPELPRYVGGGGTSLPSQMAIGATGNPWFAYEFGRITAREARAVGIQWTNSPVADVNNNPNNPIINTRSFGENPGQVAKMVEAYVRGVQVGRVIATLKHFPGHGDTEEDTHMKLPSLPFDRGRLDSVEFVPFKAGIAAGARAVMTAHIAMPQIDPIKRPATLSPVMITDVLRKQLGFDGLVITDGMTMQGVTDRYGPDEAAIGALEAGADVVLVPADFDKAYNGVLGAVRSGRISQARLDQSVRRVLAAKAWAGLDRERLVDLESISSIVGSPQAELSADSMFTAAVTLLRNEHGLLPLAKKSRIQIVTVTDEPDLQAGEALNDLLQPHVQSVTLSRLWNESGVEAADRVVAQSRNADVVILGVYLSVGSWKGPLGFSRELGRFIEKIDNMKKPVVTVAFGDPYVLGKLPATGAEIAIYTGLRKAEEAVGKAIVGLTGIHGVLPVTIPGKFKRGEGIQLPPPQRPGS
jgi:beta-N-acetylhexosaminidase